VFANVDAAEKWFEENDPEASRSSMSFLNERHRPPRHYVHDAHRGARSDLESARSLIVMSGLTRIPDSRWTLHHVRKVPKAEKLNAIIYCGDGHGGGGGGHGGAVASIAALVSKALV
jgi:hypothetical protein